MAHRGTSEKALETWARKRFQSEGYHVVKLANLAGPGFPDHSIFIGEGRVAFVEYKTPKGRFGPLQEWWLGWRNLVQLETTHTHQGI